GRTIINTVLQVSLNLMEHGMNIQQAVNAGRLHHQWLPDVVRIERGTISEETAAALRAMGHELDIGGTQGR
ncbi:MAG: gamma-glutamyltransferase, partial [Gemmatimonadetes bacterium]|nr:gamma-glutamyltransferase [Gemmatimonadota bacterium]NIQ56763.1 gamma-glutamyltransferase [Gemmatimonadota bacterium]NIU78621.1 gamma-glutamyltransferase [Gammaproteobacteria bacterium]NIX47464.1 gamma-glutamyltransferase [Gemmatimonadota bacterium]NIY11847.1 gamma-glutamyltransferase [Gemmatimonadota bacterium]